MATLKWLNSLLTAVRPLLETLYFLAAIALVPIAIKGLEQLKIAKETARTNAQREAFKLAAEECRNFALHVVPLVEALDNLVQNLKLTSFGNTKFRISKGEISEHNFSVDRLKIEFPKCGHDLIAFLNALEAFSIFFASRIADETVAYRETGETFLKIAAKYMPGIYLLRALKSGRFESTVELYELWDARMQSENLLRSKESINTALESLKKEPLRPIGTE
jgi:hypothetical protein